MNWLDLVIIICIGVGIIKGLFDGLIKQVISLIALFLSVLFAGFLASLIQPLIGSFGVVPVHLEYPVACVLSFILIFVLMGMVGRLLENVVNWTFLGCLNSLAGGFAGMLLAVVGLSLLLNLLIIFDRNSRIIGEQTKAESVLFSSVQSVVPRLYPYIKHKVEKGFDGDPLFDWKNKEELPDFFKRKEVEPSKSPEEENEELIVI